jgi:hypothetical protein
MTDNDRFCNRSVAVKRYSRTSAVGPEPSLAPPTTAAAHAPNPTFENFQARRSAARIRHSIKQIVTAYGGVAA